MNLQEALNVFNCSLSDLGKIDFKLTNDVLTRQLREHNKTNTVMYRKEIEKQIQALSVILAFAS